MNAEAKYQRANKLMEEDPSNNVVEAFSLYADAAEAGHVQAQFEMGTSYLVLGDIETAIRWYTIAADAGSVDAQDALAKINKPQKETPTYPTKRKTGRVGIIVGSIIGMLVLGMAVANANVSDTVFFVFMWIGFGMGGNFAVILPDLREEMADGRAKGGSGILNFLSSLVIVLSVILLIDGIVSVAKGIMVFLAGPIVPVWRVIKMRKPREKPEVPHPAPATPLIMQHTPTALAPEEVLHPVGLISNEAEDPSGSNKDGGRNDTTLHDMDSRPAVVAASTPTYMANPPTAKTKKRGLLIACLLVVIVMGVGLAFRFPWFLSDMFNRRGTEDHPLVGTWVLNDFLFFGDDGSDTSWPEIGTVVIFHSDWSGWHSDLGDFHWQLGNPDWDRENYILITRAGHLAEWVSWQYSGALMLIWHYANGMVGQYWFVRPEALPWGGIPPAPPIPPDPDPIPFDVYARLGARGASLPSRTIEHVCTTYTVVLDENGRLWAIRDFTDWGSAADKAHILLMEDIAYIVGARWAALDGGDGIRGLSQTMLYVVTTRDELWRIEGTVRYVNIDDYGFMRQHEFTGSFADNEPVLVMNDVVYAASSGLHVLAVTADNHLWAWGRNGQGQLGDGTFNDSDTPVFIMGNVATAVATRWRSMAVALDGGLYVWGRDKLGDIWVFWAYDTYITTPLRVLESVRQAAQTDESISQTYVIMDDGHLWTLGHNQTGVEGLWAGEWSHDPMLVMENVAAVSARRHVMALTQDGNLWTWGENWSGQLGDGTLNERRYAYAPVFIKTGVASVSAIRPIWVNGDYTVATLADGTTWTWGNGNLFYYSDGGWIFGRGSLVPEQITLLSPANRAYARLTTHTVQPGDTVEHIAHRFGVTISQITEPNNLAFPYHLQVGMELIISGRFVPPPIDYLSVDHTYDAARLVHTVLRRVVEIWGLVDTTVDVQVHENALFITLDPDWMFNTFQSELVLAGPEMLSAILSAGVAFGSVMVEVHTDVQPLPSVSPYANLTAFTQARANAIMDYFMPISFPPGNMYTPRGMGEHFPIANNDTVEGRAANRRVEIVAVVVGLE